MSQSGKVLKDAGSLEALSAPSYLKLRDEDGNSYYISVDTDGVLRIGSSPPGVALGNAVGNQSGEM